MALAEQRQLVERFHAVRDFLRTTCAHWQLGSSYDAYVGAQTREQSRLVPLLVQQFRRLMQTLPGYRTGSRWLGFGVDGSDLGCPRTRENQPAMGDRGKPDGTPLLSLTNLLHLQLGLPWAFRVGPASESERAHLRDMFAELPANSLLVADAGFIGYQLCRDLIERNQHFLLRVGGNVRLFESLGYAAEIAGKTVYLWPGAAQLAAQPPVTLRLIELLDEQRQPVYLVTSVLDEQELSDAEAGEWFRLRWGLEVTFRTFKQTLERPQTSSRTPENCYLELTWNLVGLWLLELLTALRVSQAGHEPRSISPALARNAIRRVLRQQSPLPGRRCALKTVLANCRLDTYQRKHAKASRDYPRKKRHQPPGPPILKPPQPQQLQLAKQLTSIALRI